MDTQQESSQKINSPDASIYVDTDACISISKRTWTQAFNDKAVYFQLPWGSSDVTLGYKIVWFLWSADIWFGRFPLLKFIVGVNILLWIITIWINA